VGRATRRGRVEGREVGRGRESAEGHPFGAMGQCLLCGFELGDDGSGLPRTGSHTKRTCGMKSPPCRHKLTAEHPFAKEGACFALACCCMAKCSKCNRVGHRVDTMVLSPDRIQMDPKSSNVKRRRLEPPLSFSDFVCSAVTDTIVAEGLRAHYVACWKEWSDTQQSASAAAELVANFHDAGLDRICAADLLSDEGVVAATNHADNRTVFDGMVGALADPNQTDFGAALVGAAAGAAAARSGRGGGRGAAAAARGGPGGRGGRGDHGGCGAAAGGSGGTPPVPGGDGRGGGTVAGPRSGGGDGGDAGAADDDKISLIGGSPGGTSPARSREAQPGSGGRPVRGRGALSLPTGRGRRSFS